MKKVARRYDIKKLVYELGNNKVDALELLREAISNAKDHQAQNLYVRAKRDNQGRVSLLLIDDGHGLSEPRWEAFWGAAASSKVEGERSIGYKGFGTKLYFHCARLSVASRASTREPWHLVSVDRPSEDDRQNFDMVELPDSHELAKGLRETGVAQKTATAILIEDLQFTDKERLLSYERIISYCDWFTVLGDVRSGLFNSRLDFHQAIQQGGRALDGLRTSEVPLRPIQVHLQLNGAKTFSPLGVGALHNGQGFFDAWNDDGAEFRSKSPELWMFGHRFADPHPGGVSKGGQRKDDRTALRLTTTGDWVDDHGFSIVAHVEGHRRQRETYPEASGVRSQGRKGVYSFEERFGLWLCRDYVAVAQRNDLLKRAIMEAETRGLDQDFKTLRNWKVFVNHQAFLPIANRGDVSNFAEYESRLFEALVDLLRRAFKQHDFVDWIHKLQAARRERERDNEKAFMDDRQRKVIDWVKAKTKESVDPIDVPMRPRDPEESLRIPVPSNEQELFYLYAQLSARFEVPIFILEYQTREGVDAIGRVRTRGLLGSDAGYARVEFKFEVESGYPIGHYFDSIDVIICWRVGKIGAISEDGAISMEGQLRRRDKPVLDPPFDTHEIVYEQVGGAERAIPVLQVSALFGDKKATKGKR
ncbi:MAG: ATP-binding protein [Polyangiaceae bacterium]|nr:ATP-binding protein [Polyangiaceae bacterium]